MRYASILDNSFFIQKHDIKQITMSTCFVQLVIYSFTSSQATQVR